MSEERDLIDIGKQCLIPRISFGSERPCDASDFVKFIQENIGRLRTLKSAIFAEKIGNSGKLSEKEFLTLILIIVGENHCDFPWNNSEICQLCCQIREMIFNGCSEQQLLTTGIPQLGVSALLKPVLLALRPKLLKETWKEYPAAVECFAWVLSNLKAPSIAECIQHVLPTALLLVDDFVNENRVTGVKCLKLIGNDLTVAELKYHGYGELIYKSLQSLLRERDPTVADIVIPCLFSLMIKLETDYGDVQPFYKWSRFDDTLEILLEIMEIESKIALRTVYIKNLQLILKVIGARACRWTKRLLSIFDHYLETAGDSGDEKSVALLLEAFQTFLDVTESVKNCYRSTALFILFRLLYHITEHPCHKGNHATLLHCLKLVLTGCTAEESKVILNDAENELNFHPVGDSIVKLMHSHISS